MSTFSNGFDPCCHNGVDAEALIKYQNAYTEAVSKIASVGEALDKHSGMTFDESKGTDPHNMMTSVNNKLQKYVLKTELDSLAKQSELDGYAKKSSFEAHADERVEENATPDPHGVKKYVDSKLVPYVKQTDMSAYVKGEALDDYAKKEVLDDYAVKSDIPGTAEVKQMLSEYTIMTPMYSGASLRPNTNGCYMVCTLPIGCSRTCIKYDGDDTLTAIIDVTITKIGVDAYTGSLSVAFSRRQGTWEGLTFAIARSTYDNGDDTVCFVLAVYADNMFAGQVNSPGGIANGLAFKVKGGVECRNVHGMHVVAPDNFIAGTITIINDNIDYGVAANNISVSSIDKQIADIKELINELNELQVELTDGLPFRFEADTVPGEGGYTNNTLVVGNKATDAIRFEKLPYVQKQTEDGGYITDVVATNRDIATAAIPIGAMLYWPNMDKIPEGYLPCDGSEFLPEELPELNDLCDGRLPKAENMIIKAKPGKVESVLDGPTNGEPMLDWIRKLIEAEVDLRVSGDKRLDDRLTEESEARRTNDGVIAASAKEAVETADEAKDIADKANSAADEARDTAEAAKNTAEGLSGAIATSNDNVAELTSKVAELASRVGKTENASLVTAAILVRNGIELNAANVIVFDGELTTEKEITVNNDGVDEPFEFTDGANIYAVLTNSTSPAAWPDGLYRFEHIAEETGLVHWSEHITTLDSINGLEAK